MQFGCLNVHSGAREMGQFTASVRSGALIPSVHVKLWAWQYMTVVLTIHLSGTHGFLAAMSLLPAQV